MKIQEASIEEIPSISKISCSKFIPAISVTKPQTKSNTSQAKDTGKKVQQADDDFAKLIIPKTIIPSRLAKMASVMGANVSKSGKNVTNQKNASNAKAQRAVSGKKNPTIFRNGSPKIVMSKNNFTTYDNGIVIEEL